MQPPLILASASPRRRELLASLGLSFEVAPADLDESILPGEDPEQMTVRLAHSKARLVAERYPNACVIGADTTVAFGRAALGKPINAADAESMLRLLRGDVHQVVTAVSVLRLGSYRASDVVQTGVAMRQYADAEMAAYITSGDVFDKAGAYAIQHEGFRPVTRIEGCYSNVMGLPLCALYSALSKAGFVLDVCALRFCNSYHNVCPRASRFLQGKACD